MPLMVSCILSVASSQFTKQRSEGVDGPADDAEAQGLSLIAVYGSRGNRRR